MNTEKERGRRRNMARIHNVILGGTALMLTYLGFAVYESTDNPSYARPDFPLRIGITADTHKDPSYQDLMIPLSGPPPILSPGEALFMECGDLLNLQEKILRPPPLTIISNEDRYRNNVTRISGKIDGNPIWGDSISNPGESLSYESRIIEKLPTEPGSHTAECEIELDNDVIRSVSADFSMTP